MTKLFEGALRSKKRVAKIVAVVLIFWLIQFGYQSMNLAGDENVSNALIRSFAFASATLIGLSLLSGPLVRFFPKMNYVRYRRELGVLGFCLAFCHFLVIFVVVFSFNFSSILWNTDPFVNALMFGLVALILLIPAFLTSTDWAVQKLGRKWKLVQRVVYVAWLVLVLHFVQINPDIMLTPPGFVLLAVTGLVFIFQLASFFRYSRKGVNTIAGILLILVALALFYIEYTTAKSGTLLRIIEYGFAVVVIGAVLVLLYNRFKRKPAPAAAPVEPAQPVAQPEPPSQPEPATQ